MGLYVLEFTANDVPPVITNQFNEQFILNSDTVVISGNFFDDNNLSDAKLYYRSNTESVVGDWQMVSDINGPTENIYEFEIPGQSHLTEVEYYFAAIDN